MPGGALVAFCLLVWSSSSPLRLRFSVCLPTGTWAEQPPGQSTPQSQLSHPHSCPQPGSEPQRSTLTWKHWFHWLFRWFCSIWKVPSRWFCTVSGLKSWSMFESSRLMGNKKLEYIIYQKHRSRPLFGKINIQNHYSSGMKGTMLKQNGSYQRQHTELKYKLFRESLLQAISVWWIIKMCLRVSCCC